MSDKTAAKFTLWILVVVGGIIVLSVTLVLKQVFQHKVESAPAEPVLVEVMKVTKAPAVEEIWFAGRAEPCRDVIVSTETAGRFGEMPVDVGSKVKMGDVLIRIDDSVASAAESQAKAQRDQAKRELNRLSELKKTGAVADSAYDSALTMYEVSEAAFRQAGAMLEKHTVRSPMDGRIEERYVEPGEYAGDGNRAFRIVDLSTAKVEVYIPESDILDVRKDGELVITVGAYGDERFKGKVSFVADAADPMKHAFRVELQADNSDGRIKGGMIVNVLLERSTKEPVIRVPFSSVLPKKGEHVVFTLENGHAVRRSVRIHSLSGDSALISAGLEDGELVITAGQRLLQDGKRVAVQPSAAE